MNQNRHFTFETKSPEGTIKAGKALAKYLEAGDVISLSGQLGAGKTVFCKGVASGLGISETIISPTFIILRIYHGSLPLYHFDAYRINSSKDFEDIGYEEYLYGDGVSLIEWGDKIKKILPNNRLEVSIHYGQEKNIRSIKIKGYGKKWMELNSVWVKQIQA